MTIRLLLFGSPTIEYGGQSLALPFERRNQLLAFLALKRAWVGRAELAALLWPEQENKLAYTNLRKTLHRLQSLPWARAIESHGGALRFTADTDVWAFDSALREQCIVDALPMHRGEFLAGFDDDQSEAWSSWLSFERDRLRLAWRDAALNRLAADIETTDAIDLSARLLDADPLDEAALRAHMSWLARGGQSARARQAYQAFVKRLADDLGLAPGSELRALHDSLGTAVWTPVPAASGQPTKLDEDFVGRTVELRRIGKLLAQDDCRLLSLVGPGGVGKTRLAQRAMREFGPRFSDGAVFVQLEDIDSAGELGGHIARELGIVLAGTQDALGQVIKHLNDRQLLLVLDNFEQLAANAAILGKLIQACVRVKILVTTRVRLGLINEWLLPLEGLPFPEPEDQEQFEAFDAVRLFIQAAQRVEPAFVPAAEVSSIVDICQQVEGLPLALQLAAAWTRVLSCEAIAAELRRGAELLHAVDAAHPARHASLEVVFDHSWRLLTATERDALPRLSVFHGGFSAEAARAVTGAPLPVLGALSDKSLLRKDGTRIFLHPLVQQLAAVRLTGEARESTERAHAMYFHRVLQQVRGNVEKGDGKTLQHVDTEFENCRAACRWVIAHAAVDTMTQSVPTLQFFFEHRSRFEEGVSMLTQAAQAPAFESNPQALGTLLAAIAQLQFRLERYPAAIATAERGRDAAQSARDHAIHGQCLQVLGLCSMRLVRHADAKHYFKLGLQQATKVSDVRKIESMLHNGALVEKLLGNRDEALRLFLETLGRAQGLGDVAGEALILANIGLLYAESGELESAIAQLKAGLMICERHGIIGTRSLILANLTTLALKAGDRTSAQAYGEQALDLAQATGNQYVVSYIQLRFLRLALLRGDLQTARANLTSSLQIAIGIGRPSLLLEGVACFAELLAARGNLDCARMTLTFVANHPLLNIPERDDAKRRLAQWPSEAGEERAWPGLDLNELVHRIIVESDISHAPLIAMLRNAGKLVAVS